MIGVVVKKRIYIAWFTLVMSGVADARWQDAYANESLLLVLKNAQSYLDILPERTVQILNDNHLMVDYLSDEQKLAWYKAKILATTRISDLDGLESAIRQVATLQSAAHFDQHAYAVFTGMAIWLRRSGYLEQAKLVYSNMLERSQNSEDQINILRNLAVVEHQMGNIELSLKLNELVLRIAQSNGQLKNLAISKNNLGIISLSKQQFPQAKEYFIQSMELNHKLQRRTGELLNSINLLYIFVAQNENLLYSRILPRIERMLALYPNKSRDAYLRVLTLVHAAQNGRAVDDKLIEQANREFGNIDDRGIQMLLEPLLDKNNIPIHYVNTEVSKNYQGDLLNLFSEYNWQKYSSSDYVDVLISKLDIHHPF